MARHSSRRAVSTLALAVLLAGTGCGRSGAARPTPTDPGIAKGGSSGSRPAPGTEARQPGPGKASTPSKLDPSEEITAEELATIPEPLPAPTAALKRSEDQPMKTVPQAPPETPSGAAQTEGTAVPEPVPGTSVWRVQIFASDQREEAERVGRDAAEALGAPAYVERDGALFKVRLGRFATEAEAQALRERAIRAGYPGAFRIRTPR
jgi:rare lipoprotein A